MNAQNETSEALKELKTKVMERIKQEEIIANAKTFHESLALTSQMQRSGDFLQELLGIISKIEKQWRLH